MRKPLSMLVLVLVVSVLPAMLRNRTGRRSLPPSPPPRPNR